MPRRTYEKDAQYIVVADDLDEIVKDKRLMWRADSSKANHRQRRSDRSSTPRRRLRRTEPRSTRRQRQSKSASARRGPAGAGSGRERLPTRTRTIDE